MTLRFRPDHAGYWLANTPVRSLVYNKIQQRHQDDPDHVDEVPVHLGGREGKVFLLAEIPMQSTEVTDGKEENADGNVGTMESGQGVKVGAVDIGAGTKAVRVIFVE